jgi:hypothetical protein
MAFSASAVVNIVFSFLVFLLIYKIHEYLVGLRSCACAPQVYAARLSALELFYLATTGLSLLFSLASLFMSDQKLSPIAARNIMALSFAFVCLVLLVHCFFVYNVYEFFITLKSQCKCAMEWERQVMYVQALLYSMPILALIVGIIAAVFFQDAHKQSK